MTDNIIKFSLLKNSLRSNLDIFECYNKALVISLAGVKNKVDTSYDHYIHLFTFYTIFFEILYFLNLIQPLLDLKNVDIKNLTEDQFNLVTNFSFFLIKFWCNGLKFFVNYLYIKDNYDFLWGAVYFDLIFFWLQIPNYLNVLQSILELPPCINLNPHILNDMYLFILDNEALFHIFTLWYCNQMDQKKYKDWFNYKPVVESCLKYSWHKLSPEFLSYMFILLKESNKNINFNIEKKDYDYV